ncbi:MAG: HAMP domain-containing protein [bacterium]|nr:HAMP domain-containing protein [bacterium]
MASGFETGEGDGSLKPGLSLGWRILGLAMVLLICLTSVASFSLYRLSNVRDGIDRLNGYWFPMTRDISEIDEAVLAQRLAFERILNLYAMRPLPEEQIAQEKQSWIKMGGEIDSLISSTRSLPTADPNEGDGALVASLSATLASIADRQKAARNQAHQILTLMATGRQGEADALLAVVETDEVAFEKTIETRQGVFETAFRNAARDAAKHESQVLHVNAIATALAVVFGLVFAILTAAKLTAPIRQLMEKMRDVGSGNLDVHLRQTSRDEVGSLTHSFNDMVVKLQQKDTIKKTFGKYVDSRIVEQLVERAEEPQTVGKNQVMTVLFQDVIGLEAIAQRLNPEIGLRMINRYLTQMSAPVADHGGIIDKFIDTMVMAFWGMPFTGEEDHAKMACACALAQVALMEDLCRWVSLAGNADGKTAPLALQVGLATGPLVVGNMGSEQAKSYTVMGDTVNIASRLKGANKEYGTQVLMTRETHELSETHMVTREIDLIKVVGKDEPVRIYELLGSAAGAVTQVTQLQGLFQEALVSYREQTWSKAQELFEACLHARPGDGPSEAYLKRIAIFRKTPPPGNWDGVWQLNKK